MNETHHSVGNITTGDITQSQGVGVGQNVSVTVTGVNRASGPAVDPQQFRLVLEALYDHLQSAGLPKDKMRAAQTATGNAIEALADKDAKRDVVVENVKKVGETLRQANLTIKEGEGLWHSIQALAPLLGPLAGGAHIVAGWFGL